MSPSQSEGPGKPRHTLQNGKIITLEVFQSPREYPKDPIPAQPKKGEAKTYKYPKYSRALYDLNAQTDQTYCNAISQFIKQDGADADIPGFLTFVCEYGPKKSSSAQYRIQTFAGLCDARSRAGSYCHYYSSKEYHCNRPRDVLEGEAAKRYKYLSNLMHKQAGTSISPSSSQQGDNSAFDEIQDNLSIGTGQLARDDFASGPVDSGRHINDFRADAYQMTITQNLATIGGKDPVNVDPNLAPASRSADNNGRATSDSASSVASRTLLSQALVTHDASAPQYLASSSVFRSSSANGHPPTLSVELLLDPLYFRQGGQSLWSGWYGSRGGEGWTSNRINLAPIDGLEPLYFADTPYQYHFSGYLGNRNRSGYFFVGLDYYAGYAVSHHSGLTGDGYGNSSGGGGMSNAGPGSCRGGGGTQDDGGTIPPGYERAT